MNGFPFFPALCCLKTAGPLLVSFMAVIAIIKMGNSITIAVREMKISSPRLQMSKKLIKNVYPSLMLVSMFKFSLGHIRTF